MRQNKLITILILILSLSCSEKEKTLTPKPLSQDPYILGADISEQMNINETNTIFMDSLGNPIDLVSFFLNHGINTIRLRTWVGNNKYNLQKVANYSKSLIFSGIRTWIDIHYSEFWADPGNQAIPKNWKGLKFEILLDSVKNYTALVCSATKPYIIQVGNEINGGFLWPQGSTSDTTQFFRLLRAATNQCRQSSPSSKILIHYAGYKNSLNFFWWLKDHHVDYDIAGLSYYPKWHGKSLDSLFNSLNSIHYYLNKQAIIAETSYPFTLLWNDYTFNPMGSQTDLLDEYPATPNGQYSYMKNLYSRSKSLNFNSGICYWENTWIAYKGKTSTDGSPWENQTWFDFNNKALPIFNAFKP